MYNDTMRLLPLAPSSCAQQQQLSQTHGDVGESFSTFATGKPLCLIRKLLLLFQERKVAKTVIANLAYDFGWAGMRENIFGEKIGLPMFVL